MKHIRVGRLRIMLATFLLPVLLSALPSSVVGLAHADNGAYLNEVQSTVRVRMNENQAMRLGSAACQTLRKGPDGQITDQSRAEAAQAVARTSRSVGVNRNDGLDRGNAMRLTVAAEHHLC